jgi:dynein heavy chain
VRNELFKEKDTQESIARLFELNVKVEQQLKEKLLESKSNAYHLEFLGERVEPIYGGSLEEIERSLLPLINTIKMIYTNSGYYNNSDKITGLFIKVSNQLIVRFRGMLEEGFWQADPRQKVGDIRACIRLADRYNRVYRQAKEDSRGGFDSSETQIFHELKLFCGRLELLIDLLTYVSQYDQLLALRLEHFEDIHARFSALILDFQRKRAADMFNTSKSLFEKDFKKLMAEIRGLDEAVKQLISNSFHKQKFIENSLNLLNNFRRYFTS